MEGSARAAAVVIVDPPVDPRAPFDPAVDPPVKPGAPFVYLAGPEVFLPPTAAVALSAAKAAICAAHGIAAVFPGDPSDHAASSGPAQALAFFDDLRTALDSCVAGIANLTPFRGPSADAGTVWEVGYLTGRGKPVFGYTNVVSTYRERAGALADGLAVEDFDLTDNLMLDRGVVRSNGGIEVVRRSVAPGCELTDLCGFEACVKALAHTPTAGSSRG